MKACRPSAVGEDNKWVEVWSANWPAVGVEPRFTPNSVSILAEGGENSRMQPGGNGPFPTIH
eukprot:743634-Pelagomonas_calceolata.AAC.6